ncbi:MULTISPECIES: MFS transporter [unclassified Polaromonas]|jgi:MFS family permease|uniref:MFS transporter n=1 Tax=unclassified Polaromonas TaxID=2638319 RepID=UPI000BC782F8|nr:MULTISPECIES: MFS transporter [unclassified Polaromonas]MDO9258747.1 MFS transporter [Polaromonas sp.]OYY33494.1 MAG: MFS transporter [Polaromonas sp. 35-63-35]OYZ17731.1 MAG: MFS transporter [Polaromonas sp. 16-63-31]OYZ76934.1 MAG: MFS transporter [Polaromonas sp. 24-63-21]OZA47977.1 MAG: MFS transporter [Polaromonas sp. 17-63-33]
MTSVSPLTAAADLPGLQPVQLGWLAAAVFVVSAGYGALMPLLPGWLSELTPGATEAEIARHVGFLSGTYAGGVLVGAPLWGVMSDRAGRSRILVVGLVGYVASLLLLLVPTLSSLWGMYGLRGATGFFVAAVVPVVAALVAEHTPRQQRARRFAWLSAMSLLGFLFGPGMGVIADGIGALLISGVVSPSLSARLVIVLSAVLGATMMAGLTVTLPTTQPANAAAQISPGASTEGRHLALWWMNGVVMLVLAGFELGILLQGQQHPGVSSREIGLMFAECSLVMLGVNALLFFTNMLERVQSRWLIGVGLLFAMAGLLVLARHRSDIWMYVGISLTAAGTGLVLPVIAYLGASVSRQMLSVTMGGLAAAASFGQTLGSSAGGWIFGAFARDSFAWLALPLAVMLVLLLMCPRWLSAVYASPTIHPALPEPRD